MWNKWPKRALAYLLLASVAAGVIWLLRSTAVEVRMVVDISHSRKLGALELREVHLSVFDSKGDWVGSSVLTYPPELHPHGPPAETPPIPMKLPRGQYDVRMEFLYGPPEHPAVAVRRVAAEIKEEGLMRLEGP